MEINIGIDPGDSKHIAGAHAPAVVDPNTGAQNTSRAAPRNYSFGGTAAIVTSVGLIVGFGAASISRATIVSGLLIIALADNISDSLSIHIYQESENLEARAAFRATFTNFVTRFVVAMSFVAVALLVPSSAVAAVSLGWGLLLLGALTFGVARLRNVNPGREILKHIVVALVVVGVSRVLGGWIAIHVQ
jgi:VIT1/CCC1 family predicted Fe2+/Mn2+ transporter